MTIRLVTRKVSGLAASLHCSRASLRALHAMPAEINGETSMKILMLHGYTQNGDLFHAKTRVLEKHLEKTFPGTKFFYPTGPISLRPSDIPGFDSSVSDASEVQAFGWWRRSNTSDPPEYTGMQKGFSTVSALLSSEGPFDGVIGFSQGAALAAMTASLLEGQSRKDAFDKAKQKSKYAIAFPPSFENLAHPPLKFCIAYCGFRAPGERYEAFYEPNIQTPTCHFIGSLDTVVEESRTQALVDACGGATKTQIVTHPGGSLCAIW